MDIFEAALNKYFENEDKISELVSLNKEYRKSLPTLLNDHITTFTLIPHLKSDEFEQNYLTYHQNRDVVPFYVMQFVIFSSFDKQYILILSHAFGVKNYDNYSKSGEVTLLDRNGINLEGDISNVYGKFDFVTLSLSNVGSSTRELDKTLTLISRVPISKYPVKDILENLNLKTLDMVQSEKINPTFNFGMVERRSALKSLNKCSENAILKISSKNIYDNTEDEMSSSEKDIISNISTIVLNNDLLFSTSLKGDAGSAVSKTTKKI